MSDALQSFLVTSHEKGESCLLVVDEAQLLDFEALEQLRLFTNIETNDKKLLQIILIGQPELQEKLMKRELRQLAQRITARYHLLPLTEQETLEYINHRLQSVGSVRPLFDKKAIKTLFKYIDMKWLFISKTYNFQLFLVIVNLEILSSDDKKTIFINGKSSDFMIWKGQFFYFFGQKWKFFDLITFCKKNGPFCNLKKF